ncbi:MAG: sulfatase [Pirellulaceae bacterium]
MLNVCRWRWLCVASLVLAGGVFAGRIATAADSKSPNIIFFLTDDQRADFLGCAGHPIVKTPNIDRLAAEGVRFENMFVTTSICAASRATLFSGLYERTHRYTFGTPPMNPEHTAASYGALLRKAGYRTGFVGKFGVGVQRGEQQKMFDYFAPLNRNPYFKKQADGSLRHLTEIAGDKAEEFLESCDDAQPFCLSVSFNASHAEDSDKENHYPWPKAVDGMYDDLTMPPPKLADPAVYESQPDFLKKSLNRERYFWRWDTPEKYQKNTRAYFRMITGLDNVIGRVLKKTDQLGFADNTVVIYAADNGYYHASRGFAGKWSHYEESLRVPLVIYDPRAPKDLRGRTLPQMALNVDIPATILAYAGVEIPDTYQGENLKPLVEGEKLKTWRHDFFCEHLMDVGARIPKWEGVRDQRYVYARYFEQEPVYEFLHDLQADPDQLKNFVSDDAYAEVLAKMRRRCDELRDGYGGPYQAWPKKN